VRREATRARVVDAAVATLAERGYAGITIARVVELAAISVGGLYRHFPTLIDLLLAASDEIRNRQLGEFRDGLAEVGSLSEEECIDLLRAVRRKPVSGAWYDLQIGARSDPELRARLHVHTEAYQNEVLASARNLPVASDWEPEAFDVAILSLIHILDGEALSAAVRDQGAVEEYRTRMLAAVLRGEPIPGAPAAQVPGAPPAATTDA